MWWNNFRGWNVQWVSVSIRWGACAYVPVVIVLLCVKKRYESRQFFRWNSTCTTLMVECLSPSQFQHLSSSINITSQPYKPDIFFSLGLQFKHPLHHTFCLRLCDTSSWFHNIALLLAYNSKAIRETIILLDLIKTKFATFVLSSDDIHRKYSVHRSCMHYATKFGIFANFQTYILWR